MADEPGRNRTPRELAASDEDTKQEADQVVADAQVDLERKLGYLGDKAEKVPLNDPERTVVLIEQP